MSDPSEAAGGEGPCVCLMGPTAVGKTELAVWLVSQGPFEIVSVDSAMVYRRMDIGTGKPDGPTLERAPHRLIDIREPHETYSAAQFRRDAEAEVASIRRAGRIPLLVGGTGMYFSALLRGLSRMPPADPALRRELCRQAAQEGWPAMHARLADVDPAAAARIHPNDVQRIQRALEVARQSGSTLSRLHADGRGPNLSATVHTLSLAVPERGLLHARIRARFESMLARGFVEEVRGLRSDPRLSLDLPAMRAVGYRQIWSWLEGGTHFEAMVESALAATRQLAKRQLTWLRTQAHATAFDAGARCLREQVLRHLEGRLGRASL